MLENKIEELTQAVERLSEILLGMPDPNQCQTTEVEQNAKKQVAKTEKDETETVSETSEQPVSNDANSSATLQDLQDLILRIAREKPDCKTQIKAILESVGAKRVQDLPEKHIDDVFAKVGEL